MPYNSLLSSLNDRVLSMGGNGSSNQQNLLMNFSTSLKSLMIFFPSYFLRDPKSISCLETQISFLMCCLSWAFSALQLVTLTKWLAIKHPSVTAFSTAITWLWMRKGKRMSQPSKHPLSAAGFLFLGLTVPALLWFPVSSHGRTWKLLGAFSRGSCFLYWFIRF